jgi:hypothetical protein
VQWVQRGQLREVGGAGGAGGRENALGAARAAISAFQAGFERLSGLPAPLFVLDKVPDDL